MSGSKTLYLVRHADSSWFNAGESDFDRPLNERGRCDAPEMGRRLKKEAATLPEIIVCSPAKRARQTLEYLDLGVENVVFDEGIYEASTGDLLKIVQALPNRYRSAMLIGHNPAMSWLTNRLSGMPLANMPTGTIAAVSLTSAYWSKADACPAELQGFYFPGQAAE